MLADSTTVVQSMLATWRKLAMEFAITSCVSASSCAERCAASSTVMTSSASHCSSQSSGVKSDRRLRICCRNLVRNAGVRVGPRCTNAARSSSPNGPASMRRDTHASADARSATSRDARRAIRLTFSRYPIRNIAGIAHSSPSVSALTRWYSVRTERHARFVEAPIRVGDQLDDDVVNPGISGAQSVTGPAWAARDSSRPEASHESPAAARQQ